MWEEWLVLFNEISKDTSVTVTENCKQFYNFTGKDTIVFFQPGKNNKEQ